MKQKNNQIYLIILVVAIAGVGLGAWKFFKSSNSNQTNATQNQANNLSNAPGGGFGGRSGSSGRNFTPLHGSITAIDQTGSTLTMKADDGSSKTIDCSSARISEQQNGQMAQLTLADLKSGDEINVMAGDTSQSPIKPRMIIIGTFTRPQRSSGQSGGWGSGWGGSQQPDGSAQPDGSSNGT